MAVSEIKIPSINIEAPKKEKRGFFEPVPDKVRVRDILREIPGQALEVGKEILRAPGRAAAAATLTARGEKELIPVTPSEKFLFGERPVKSLGEQEKSVSSFLEDIGISPVTAGAISPFAVLAGGVLDVYPGGGLRRRAFNAAEDVVKTIAQTRRFETIYDIVKKEVPNISEERVVNVSKNLMRETNPQKVANKLNNEIRLIETGALKPSIRKEIETPKEIPPPIMEKPKIEPLAQEARKYKSAEEFVRTRSIKKGNTYEVMFGKQGIDRDVEVFTSIKKAEEFALQKIKKGEKNIFLDSYNNEQDLLDSKNISQLTDIWNKANATKPKIEFEKLHPKVQKQILAEQEATRIAKLEAQRAGAEVTPTLHEQQLMEFPEARAMEEATGTETGLLRFGAEEEPTARSISQIFEEQGAVSYQRTELTNLRETIRSHPARNLIKYVNKKTRELPEVLGVRGRGEFKQRGDDIVTELGYPDSETARADIANYFELLDREKNLTKQVFAEERRLGKEMKEARFEERRLEKGEPMRAPVSRVSPAPAEYQQYRDIIRSESGFGKRFINKTREFLKTEKKTSFIFKELSKLKSEDGLIGRYGRSISSRLKQIHPELKRVARELEIGMNNWMIKRNDEFTGLFDGLKKISRASADDYIDLNFALLRRDRARLLDVADKYGLRRTFSESFKTLTKIFDEAKAAGVEVSFLEDFFPRHVADPRGLMNYIRDTFGAADNWKFFNEALKREATRIGRALNTVEQADVINRLMMGRRVNGISVREIGIIPHRTVDVVTPEMAKFYTGAPDALAFYLRNMAEKIQYSRLFNLKGKDGELSDVMGSLGARILKLEKAGTFSHEDHLALMRIFQARMKETGTHGIVSGFKNLTYMATIGNPFSALRQIGDFGTGMYDAKSDYLSAWLKAVLGKSDIKVGDVIPQQIERISAEFGDQSRLARWLSKMLKVTGFEKIDAIGKEALMNGVVARYQRMAQQGKLTPRMQRRLEEFFGDNTEAVLADLRSGKITENVRALAFNELADVQPIALSEMPEAYLTAGNGRIFYMLKSWQIKQLNFYVDEIKDIAKHEPKEAIFRVLELAAFLMVANASADVIIDTILGRDIDPGDLVVDNTLRLAGINRYLTNKARQEGVGAAMQDLLFPPTNIVDNLVRDANRFFTGETEKGFETPQNIPLLGKFYYWQYGRGATKEQEKRERTGGGISIPKISIPSISIPSINIPSISL